MVAAWESPLLPFERVRKSQDIWSVEDLRAGLRVAARALPAGTSLSGKDYEALKKQDPRIPARPVVNRVARRYRLVPAELRQEALEVVAEERASELVPA